MGCHSLLQGIFVTQGLNLGLLYCRQILYQGATRESSFHKGPCLVFGFLECTRVTLSWQRVAPHPPTFSRPSGPCMALRHQHSLIVHMITSEMMSGLEPQYWEQSRMICWALCRTFSVLLTSKISLGGRNRYNPTSQMNKWRLCTTLCNVTQGSDMAEAESSRRSLNQDV